MKKLIVLLLTLACFVPAQAQVLKKQLKFATFYTAVTGNNSLAPVDIPVIQNGTWGYNRIVTPFDYTLAFGVRKVQRLDYENRKNVFYNGTELSVSDAATVGNVDGLEYMFEVDYKRQQGNYFVDQQHLIRYLHDHWILKAEYVQDGFSNLKYFEASQRYRYNINKKFSVNTGLVQRFSEPYGVRPLTGLSDADMSLIALTDQGYFFDEGVYYNSVGEAVASNQIIWETNVLPEVATVYIDEQLALIPNQWNYSLVLGYDYYHYTKKFWFHTWASVLPLHVNSNNEYSYNNFVEGNQWLDYTGGIILGWQINKKLGAFTEGKYHKYWDKIWHDFSVGVNYVIR